MVGVCSELQGGFLDGCVDRSVQLDTNFGDRIELNSSRLLKEVEEVKYYPDCGWTTLVDCTYLNRYKIQIVYVSCCRTNNSDLTVLPRRKRVPSISILRNAIAGFRAHKDSSPVRGLLRPRQRVRLLSVDARYTVIALFEMMC